MPVAKTSLFSTRYVQKVQVSRQRHQPRTQIEQYSQLLAQAQRLLSDIHATYTRPDATDLVNITETISRDLASAINTASNVTFPAMQDMFIPARKHVEGLIQDDVYPRFVKHQLMASAAMAMAQDQKTYQGLGDCFCLTDPK
jgi:hypothetical protein